MTLRIGKFDGYPYLLTQITAGGLCSIAVLPGDWTRERLLAVAGRMRRATQLWTYLCLGQGDTVLLDTDSSEVQLSDTPSGSPEVERLALPEEVPATDELLARRAHLKAFADKLNDGGYLVGDGREGGRRASAEEKVRLAMRGPDGIPAGLRRCAICRGYRGEYLARNGEGNGDLKSRVVSVHCDCDNHNRCARCGERLAEDRLSSYTYDRKRDAVRYLAAYVALSHTCAAPARIDGKA